jgi:ketosteroid isomerase-like protein
MSRANVEVVKRLFESYRRGDYEERLFDLYTFSDGRCVRKREFRQRSDAVEAAGLEQ